MFTPIQPFVADVLRAVVARGLVAHEDLLQAVGAFHPEADHGVAVVVVFPGREELVAHEPRRLAVRRALGCLREGEADLAYAVDGFELRHAGIVHAGRTGLKTCPCEVGRSLHCMLLPAGVRSTGQREA